MAHSRIAPYCMKMCLLLKSCLSGGKQNQSFGIQRRFRNPSAPTVRFLKQNMNIFGLAQFSFRDEDVVKT